jgi:DNA polymerase (family 10)
LYVGRQIIARIGQSCPTRRAYDRGMAASLPRNGDLADQFDQLADLSEILGEQSFRVAAYRRAAARIRDTASSVAELALEGKAKELPDIGKTIEAKIVEVVETGDMEALAKRRAEVPGEVSSFMRLPGLGPKTAARIWRELGVTTLVELKAAAEGERLRTLSGMGAATEAKILKALAEGQGDTEPRRGLLGKGLPVVREVVETLRAHPSAIDVSDAGSTRRRRETFRDLDVIATASDPAALTAYFVGLPWVLEVVAHGDTKATVISKQGLRLDLRVVPPESYGDLLQHFTGSKDHNVALREHAQRNGLSISEYGVTVVETGEVKTFRDEESLYAFLGYSFIPPELRENGGELEAARNGSLPVLVELADLRGEMHCHSTWSSDGKASIEEMARAAAARGYEFLCLTDHSHYLREGRIEAQWLEIEAVNAKLGPFRVLRGVEANITARGEVDVPDELLAELDWVVASLHTSLDRSPTERVLAAIENPHVDCIGHLTGRRISRRPGADLDLDRVVARAAETRTALEINSQPDRLDMRDAHARLAGAAGVMIPIDTDAHSIGALSYAELGVGLARRAWLTKEQVLNTRSWAEIDRARA